MELALRVAPGRRCPACARLDQAPPEALARADRPLPGQGPRARPTADGGGADPGAAAAPTGRRRRSERASPFRGLLPFAERHAEFFFGREAEVAAFIERLREEPVLPVVGPSGAGKSSFVQAGVVPRLREQGPWMVLQLRPGAEPLRTLAARLLLGQGTLESASESGLTASASRGPLRTRSRSDSRPRSETPHRSEQPARQQLLAQPSLLRAQAARSWPSVQAAGCCSSWTSWRSSTPWCSRSRAARTPSCARCAAPRTIRRIRCAWSSPCATTSWAGCPRGPQVRDALGRVTVICQPRARSAGGDAHPAAGGRGLPLRRARAGRGRWWRRCGASPPACRCCSSPGRRCGTAATADQRLLLRRPTTRWAGVAGALARHADGVLEGLPAGEVQAGPGAAAAPGHRRGDTHASSPAAPAGGAGPAARDGAGPAGPGAAALGPQAPDAGRGGRGGGAGPRVAASAPGSAWRAGSRRAGRSWSALGELSQAAELWEQARRARRGGLAGARRCTRRCAPWSASRPRSPRTCDASSPSAHSGSGGGSAGGGSSSRR